MSDWFSKDGKLIVDGNHSTHYRVEDVVGPIEKKSVVLLDCGEEH